MNPNNGIPLVELYAVKSKGGWEPFVVLHGIAGGLISLNRPYKTKREAIRNMKSSWKATRIGENNEREAQLIVTQIATRVKRYLGR